MMKKPSPKPVAIMGYTIVFITFGVFGGWAAVAKLDAAVVARHYYDKGNTGLTLAISDEDDYES